MKPSEMTNSELAGWLENTTPDFEGYTSPVSDCLREAARRLRLYGDNLFVQTACEEQKRLREEIKELRECLTEATGCADEFQKFFEKHPYLCKYTRDIVARSRKALEG